MFELFRLGGESGCELSEGELFGARIYCPVPESNVGNSGMVGGGLFPLRHAGGAVCARHWMVGSLRRWRGAMVRLFFWWCLELGWVFSMLGKIEGF